MNSPIDAIATTQEGARVVGNATPAPVALPNAAGAPVSAVEAPAQIAMHARDTHKQRSPLERLLALVPMDKQAEANSAVLDLLTEAREGAAPPSMKSKLALGRGSRYRVDDAEKPKFDNASSRSHRP